MSDAEELLKRLLTSALKGDAKAQYRLGVLYTDGKIVPKDYEQAIKWYSLAAQQEHPKAQVYLAMLYQKQKDYKNAAMWYVKAAGHGEPKAQYYLGLMFLAGKGVQKNIEEALKWLDKAASQGLNDAKIALDKILAVEEISADYESENDNDDDNVSFMEEIDDIPQERENENVSASSMGSLIKIIIVSVICIALAAGTCTAIFFMMNNTNKSQIHEQVTVKPENIPAETSRNTKKSAQAPAKPAKTKDEIILDTVRQAVKEGKIPEYIFQRGKFSVRTDTDTMMITAYNVRFS